MTGNQEMLILLAAPVLGVIIARVCGFLSAVSLLAGALLAEAGAVAALMLRGRWVLHHLQQGRTTGAFAIATTVPLANRLFAYGVLLSIALVFGGLTIIIDRRLRGRPR